MHQLQNKFSYEKLSVLHNFFNIIKQINYIKKSIF